MEKQQKTIYLIRSALLIALTLLPGILANKFSETVLSIGQVLILLTSEYLIAKKFAIIRLLSSALFLIIIVEQWFLFFSGSYITVLMLENIGSITALGNSLLIYLPLFFIVLLICFFPIRIKEINLKKSILYLASLFSVLGMVITVRISRADSSLTSFPKVINALHQERQEKAKLLSMTTGEKKELVKKYFKEGIKSGFEGRRLRVKKPNVIIIFTEGMSNYLLDSENNLNLNLTSNICKFRDRSLSFRNYYNHTAATYCGLAGQVYSTYYNYHIIDHERKAFNRSLPMILRDYGYQSKWINSEPTNQEFTNYLNHLGFDQVTSSIKDRFLSDKEFFENIYNEANQQKKPFLLCGYNIGTHNGWDSCDLKYRDGKDAILNKFYNYDGQFGNFVKKFRNSKLAGNTVLIFTTDHCTYPSEDFCKTFKDSKQNYFTAPIPLMIYYSGIQPKSIDVHGRNSLCLAPTVLDVLGITNCSNYFLGSSLFVKQQSEIEQYSFIVGDNIYRTTNQGVVDLGSLGSNGYQEVSEIMKKSWIFR